MYLKSAGEILLSVFAVFGAYCFLRAVISVPFLPKCAGLLLHIPADTALCDLPFLVERVRENALFAGRVPIVALVERGGDPALTKALREADITYYMIE